MDQAVLECVNDAFDDDEELDEEARREWEEICAQKPLTAKSEVVTSTDRERARAWARWEAPWVALVENQRIRNAPADQIFTRFLETIAKDSTVKRLTLGPEEFIEEPRIHSARTISGLWKTLRGVAKFMVFDPLVQQFPDRRYLYTITGKSGERTDTPTWKITKWISDTLPELGNLTREQTFVKKEMTAEDVILHLHTLWYRASDIPCSPSDRVAYHTAVLVLACGGFRSGTTLQMPYRDVEFVLVRDPQDRSQAKLVAYITINQNKQATNVIRKDQKHMLTFAVTIVPSRMLCLARLLFARALSDKAFKDEFESLEQLLSQAKFEHVEKIQLPWKASHQGRCIIPLAYHQFWTIWKRTVLVTGARDAHQRPYSLRVGAGGDWIKDSTVDGTLTSAMRNYLLSHSTRVFEQSYQPRHFRDDVTRLCFGEQVGDHTALFQVIQNSSLERDPNAPLDATMEDYDSFEKRRDLTALRKLHSEVGQGPGGWDSDEARSIASKIQWVRAKLASLVVEQRRQEYFYEADRLRAQGLSTTALVQPQQCSGRSSSIRGGAAAEEIGKLFELSLQMENPEEKDWRSSVSLTEVLELYLDGRGRDVELLLAEARPARAVEESAVAKAPLAKDCRCLLCNMWFFSRYTLSRHNTNIHYRRGKSGNQFTSRFRCPECRSTAQNDVWIENVMHWSNHTESFHGTKCSPIPPAGARDENRAWLAKFAPGTENCPPGRGGMKLGKGMCYICLNEFSQAGGFYNHWAKHKAVIFQQPFPCPACLREKNQVVPIDGAETWYSHLVEGHEGGGPFGSLQDPECVPKKRSRAEQERSALAQKLQQQRSRPRARPPVLQRGRDVMSSECLGKKGIVGDMTLIDPRLHSEHSAQK
ncbi:hypothetical protein PG984_007267 [Apiospora sp. TS-2023a]